MSDQTDTPTPRTDAARGADGLVGYDHASTLERNLTAALAQVEELRKANAEHERQSWVNVELSEQLAKARNERDALRRERDEAWAALEKINVIRNSIVAHQSCNFSEHVYPMVAALNEVGIKGMAYPDALAYFGPTTERAAKAESERDEARRQLADERARLHAALEALEEMKLQYNPSGDLAAKVNAALEATKGSGSPRLARNQHCGCIVCICEDDEQCQGCGATNCGTHPVGQIPNPIYETK